MKTKLLLILPFFAFFSLAQNTIQGTIVNEQGNALQKVIVQLATTNSEILTDISGKFSINTELSAGRILIFSDDFDSRMIPFSMGSQKSIDLGNVVLETAIQNLQETVVTAKGIVDLEENRKTPIASTNITAKEIQDKVGNSDLPELLKSTPSVQNVRGGGFGDGQMFLRGFDQTNTAFLLNGQPINGMEDGKMYWSNWSGVTDIANGIQVQRGLGSSKLAISSVGGTTNILIKTVDMKKGGNVSVTGANNNYFKTSAYYSTGLNEKGWAFSGMLAGWQGDGYMNNTAGKGQTYFMSIGYKPNEKHVFNFLVTGAPQWHAAAGTQKLGDYVSNGFRYNSWNSKIGNEIYPGGRNYYHKPIANLTWDYSINSTSSLSTVAYGSIGRGGFASVISSAGKPLYARGSYNNHNWAGLITNYSKELGDHLSLNIGADARFYNGIHFRGVTEFFDIDTVKASSEFNGDYGVTESFAGYNPWGAIFNPNNDHKQRLGYDYKENISYIGAFGQLEYATDKVSVFFQGAVSNQSHLKTDYWNSSTETESAKVSNLGYNAKVGGAYTLDAKNKIYVNGGYYSRQPFHDELFRNIRTSDELRNPQVSNQDVTGLEAGYQFKSKYFRANVNLYQTIWANRTLASDNGETDPELTVYYNTLGVTQNHKGAEVELFYKATQALTFKGFWSAGDWRYVGNAQVKAFDDAGNDITSTLPSSELKLDGVKVGGASQTTAGLGAIFRPVPSLSLDGNFNWFNSLYSNVGASEHTISLPSYRTFDLGLTYKIDVNPTQSLKIRFNINNLTNQNFIEQSSTSIDNKGINTSWRNVDLNNIVKVGYGRTWNITFNYSF
jgi:iron complex outermembrane recepter protein